jgi:hypothetical protein
MQISKLVVSWGVELNFGAGWSSPVARWAHNPKVAGSNPAPATNLGISKCGIANCGFEKIRNSKFEIAFGGVAQLAEHMVCNHGVRGSNPLTSTNALPICVVLILE